MERPWDQPGNEPDPSVPLYQNQAIENAYPPQLGLLSNSAAVPLENFANDATNGLGWGVNNFLDPGLSNTLQAGGLASQFGTGPAIGGRYLAAEGVFNLEETMAQKLERRKNILHTAQSKTVALTSLRG